LLILRLAKQVKSDRNAWRGHNLGTRRANKDSDAGMAMDDENRPWPRLQLADATIGVIARSAGRQTPVWDRGCSVVYVLLISSPRGSPLQPDFAPPAGK